MTPSSRRQFLAAVASTSLGAVWATLAHGQTTAPRRPASAPAADGAGRPAPRPAAPASAPAPIDRRAVVSRHDVRLDRLDPATPLQVGNGDFAFGCDVTGLQTFAESYRGGVPLHAMATWAWHAAPPPEGFADRAAMLATTAREYAAPGRERPVAYFDQLTGPPSTAPATAAATQPAAAALTTPAATQPATAPAGTAPAISPVAAWLRDHPHRAALGRVALVGGADAPELRPEQVADVEQTLELWTGLIRSRFTLDGARVEVTTAAHPTLAVVAFRVRSALLAEGRLGLRVAFPAQRADPSDPDDWTRPEAHRTTRRDTDRPGVVEFDREQDALRYRARVGWSTPDATRLLAEGPHAFVLRTEADWIELVVEFAPEPAARDEVAAATSASAATVATAAAPEPPAATTMAAVAPLPSAVDVFAASTRAWERFWSDGAAIDFAACADPRAAELERRLVRSQFLTAVHCAATMPAPDTGLACNSSGGKLRLDTAWWTAAHFAMWGRPALLERQMRFYEACAPAARRIAQRQGYDGVRWPGVCGPNGEESPGESSPFWIWQQPHPIYFAEQIYRAKPTRETLERYGRLVAETARFMASFPAKAGGEALSLGPPVVPAQGLFAPERSTVRDPTFELAYWAWGLGVAQRWRERVGEPREARWDEVVQKLVKPRVRDGRYEAIGVEPFSINGGHPSFLMALGMLPKTHLIDEAAMRESARWADAQWRWETAWGADHAALAQTAARLGEPSLAIAALARDATTNRFVANGHHVPQAGMPVQLSANGALLAAVALMAGGWDGLVDPPVAPGFPKDGRWDVRVEGFPRVI